MPQASAALREYAATMDAEPVAWQYRWTNPGNRALQPDEMLEWKPIEHPNWQTLQQEIADLEAYRYDGKPCYEVRKLFAHPPAPTTQEPVAWMNVKYGTFFGAGVIAATDRNDDLIASGELVRLYTHPPAPTTQEPGAAFDPGQIVNPYRRDSAAYWAWALARAATDAERHRIGKVTDTLLKSANEVLERVIAERDALRNALDKIAERTGSDDPCANYVQIARSALRVAAEIRKGTTP